MIRNILIADDDRANLTLLTRSLEKEGYQVLAAADGLAALEIARSRPVDLLITDVVMPRMDGVDLYMALKADPASALLPVIIVTDKEMFQESFASLGLELFCPKPFNLQELLGKIRNIEANMKDRRPIYKAVVIGPDSGVLGKMADQLRERNCIVAMVNNVIEVGLRCFMMNPRLILIDLHSQEYATTREIIRSLRSYEFFKPTVIAVYSNFSCGDQAVIAGLESLDEEIHACLAAGANKYIGRYNQVTFLAQLEEFGIM